MSLIQVTGLTFAWPGSYDNIFENVTFSLDSAWKLGFTGRNGRGKTTFLKLLCGQLPHGGAISASVMFDYFPPSSADPTLLAADVAAETAPGAEAWRVAKELRLLGLEPDDVLWRPFGTLSGGEQVKLLLAALFSRETHFLLLDEPTNHLDGPAREAVARYLAQKQGFILVSHDRDLLDRCTDHTLCINRTNIEVRRGNFSAFEADKARRDAAEAAENERLRADIKRLTAAARRASTFAAKAEAEKKGTRNSGLRPDRGYLGHKAAKLQQLSQNIVRRREDAAEEKRGLLKNVEEAAPLKLSPLPYHAKRLVELRDVCVYYDGVLAAGPVSFTVEQGERVCLAGPNGCGKSTLLKLIAGEALNHTGELRVGAGARLSTVAQDTSFLAGPLQEFAQKNGLDESLFFAVLRKLDFPRVQFEKDMADYSGGQKKKVLLAQSLCSRAHLYLWDEPLNFIDVWSRVQLEELLLETQPTLLFVEHDQRFRDNVATKVIAL